MTRRDLLSFFNTMQVMDDVVECSTKLEEKCTDETAGYTTNTKCLKWPREVCRVSQKRVKKIKPVTGTSYFIDSFLSYFGVFQFEGCSKEPQEICAPVGCGFREGSEECYDKVKTIVQDIPKEHCSLEPQRTCKHVTKLVPQLQPKEECVDVPKEVCNRSKANPRKVKKPVIKKWCYTPSEQSGLV